MNALAPMTTIDFSQATPLRSLERFARLPHGHGVVPLEGHVAVYDEADLRFNDLQDGGFYVVEYQSPRAGMSRAMFATFDGSRMKVDREVVQVFRVRNPEGRWGFRHSGSCFVSGPLEDYQLTDMIVGKVVGLHGSEALS